MPFKPAVGVSDFRTLREAGAGYIDKTTFIGQVLLDPAEILVFTRPRGFGKTLNVSALRRFLERSSDDLSGIFEGLAVWDDAGARDHFQRYPVLSLGFGGARADGYDDAVAAVRREIVRLHEEHRDVLSSGALSPREARDFEAMLRGEATEDRCCEAMRTLSEQVSHCREAPVVILIDDHDALLEQGFLGGYLEEVTALLRRLFIATLRDNAALIKGVVTSTLRVSRESLSVGLNNIAAYSVLDPAYATCFGFTEPEVAAIVGGGADGERLAALRASCGGHRVGGAALLCARSVLSSLARGETAPSADMHAITLLCDALVRPAPMVTRDLDVLIGGGEVSLRIDENVVLRDLDQRSSAVWSYLLLAGFLTPAFLRRDQDFIEGTLRVPNTEAMRALEELAQVMPRSVRSPGSMRPPGSAR